MNPPQPPKTTLLIAWIVVLLTSLLPKVILQEIFGQTVSPGLQAVMSLSVIFVALLATLIWQSLRGLRPFLALFLVLVGSQWLVYTRIDELPFLHAWVSNPSFNVYMLAEELLNLMVTLLMIAALVLMRKKRKDFYLALGDTAAPVEPIRWLGVRQGERWNKFGSWLTFFISLGTLAFLVIAGRPPLDIVIRALPFLPAVLLAAALNSFTEEITYKASFLSVLESPVGPRQALYMVAVYFGIGHFYGVPYGVVGVLLAAFLGWILARSMQETRGLFWAWFIHFWQDVWIFSFMAIGSIIPGGG
jgi:CAAX protease family protein